MRLKWGYVSVSILTMQPQHKYHCLTFTDQIPQTCVRIVKITSHHRTAYLNPIYLLHINWLTCNCLGGSECLYSAVPVLAACLVPGLGLGMWGRAWGEISGIPSHHPLPLPSLSPLTRTFLTWCLVTSLSRALGRVTITSQAVSQGYPAQAARAGRDLFLMRWNIPSWRQTRSHVTKICKRRV